MKRTITISVLTVIILATTLLCVVLNKFSAMDKNDINNNDLQNPFYEEKQRNEKTVYVVYKVDLEEWASDFPEFSYNLNVGQVTNPFDAVQIAENLWKEKFEEQEYKEFAHNTERIVLYDTEKNCWWVHISFSDDCFGITPNALIEENGNVLAVWIG